MKDYIRIMIPAENPGEPIAKIEIWNLIHEMATQVTAKPAGDFEFELPDLGKEVTMQVTALNGRTLSRVKLQFGNVSFTGSGGEVAIGKFPYTTYAEIVTGRVEVSIDGQYDGLPVGGIAAGQEPGVFYITVYADHTMR